MMSEVLPFHPVTGLRAIGMGKRGPIWPVIGGAPDAEGGEPTGGEDGGDGGGDITPPAANTWWQFDSQDAAETWVNDLVAKRLSRDRKKNLEPLQQTNATLEAEIQRLKPFEEASLTDAQRHEAEKAAVAAELDALRAFKAQRERAELVSEIADEVGLDPKFLKFITTDGDDDAIRAQATDLLNALSEGGSNNGKRTPTPKAPKSNDEGGNGSGNGGTGGGGNSDESDDALIASILEETAKIRANGGIRVG